MGALPRPALSPTSTNGSPPGPAPDNRFRTFFVVATRTRLNTALTARHRSDRSSPSLTQDQRIAWIHELLTGNSVTLPYRVAGSLLLLYVRPIARIVTLQDRIPL